MPCTGTSCPHHLLVYTMQIVALEVLKVLVHKLYKFIQLLFKTKQYQKNKFIFYFIIIVALTTFVVLLICNKIVILLIFSIYVCQDFKGF